MSNQKTTKPRKTTRPSTPKSPASGSAGVVAKASAAGTTTQAAPAKAKAAPKRASAPRKRAAKPKTNPVGSVPTAPSYEQIAQRAYEIWIAKGRPIGQDDQNWREAEAQLLAEANG